jgi:hypothetical protein
MRPTDDDSPDQSADGASLADGMGETAEHGEDSSDDEWSDSTYDETYDETDEDTSYGEGAIEDESDGDISDSDDDDVPVVPEDEVVEPIDLVAHDASPLEGLGFLLDQIGDALIGDDDAGDADASVDFLVDGPGPHDPAEGAIDS